MSYAYQSYVADSYSAAAKRYSNAWEDEDDQVAHAPLEKEVVARMLGDCKGCRVLDVAGGSGNHARSAINAGATHVDVVDISAGFMEIGREIEHQLGRDVIDWHEANAYESLADQIPTLPKGGYDVVIAIWAFDHVANMTQYQTLWQNIANYLRPGGRLVAVRVADPRAESARKPVYGVQYHDFEPIKGGLAYSFSMMTDPPFTVDASSMEASYNGSTELPEKLGMTKFKKLNLADTDIVKADPDFWELLIKDPFWVAFTASKR